MYSITEARRFAYNNFSSYSVEEILRYIDNDIWELSRDKIDIQRLNHKALVELALEKVTPRQFNWKEHESSKLEVGVRVLYGVPFKEI